MILNTGHQVSQVQLRVMLQYGPIDSGTMCHLEKMAECKVMCVETAKALPHLHRPICSLIMAAVIVTIMLPEEVANPKVKILPVFTAALKTLNF